MAQKKTTRKKTNRKKTTARKTSLQRRARNASRGSGRRGGNSGRRSNNGPTGVGGTGGTAVGSSRETVDPITPNTVEERDGFVVTTRADGSATVETPDGRRFRLGPGEDVDDFLADYAEDPVAAVTDRGGRVGDAEEEEEIVDEEANNDLFAEWKAALEQFGLTPTDEFLREAVQKGWSEDTFYVKLRQQDFYLANPLFAANIERSRNGGRFMSEAEVLGWGSEAKRIAKQYGYSDPSDAYLASGLLNGKSLAEFEHIIQIQRKVDEFGPAVRDFAEAYLNEDLSDQDLFEVFSDRHDTADFDRAFKYAQYQGRPILLGFGARTEAEARAYEMLGLTPDEVFARFGQAGEVRSRTERLALIDQDLIAQNPQAIADALKGHEQLIVDAEVKGLPEARARLQELLLREGAKWRSGSGPAATGQGQLVGLLNTAERQSFG